jgi:2-oxoacid:acceptor oxidoreductase gamma subunit (pyruvate/2-ketoisovalerate family)
MIEVRFHGRGGQGVVTAAKILANAFVRQGKFGSSFPMFGFERRGAPVTAFMRFDEDPIREKTQIYNPDCLVVLDPSQKDSPIVYNGLKADGVLILNTKESIEKKPHKELGLTGLVDAEAIALEEMGISSPNTPIVGAFAAATGWIPIEHILSGMEQYFSGDILKRNIRCAERGFREVEVIQW